MEASFSFASYNHSAFLEQVPIDVRPCNAAVRRKTDSNKLPKSTGIVIALSLRISKRLQNGVSLKYLPFKEA